MLTKEESNEAAESEIEGRTSHAGRGRGSSLTLGKMKSILVVISIVVVGCETTRQDPYARAPSGVFSESFIDSGVILNLSPDRSFTFSWTGMDSHMPAIEGHWSLEGRRIVVSPACDDQDYFIIERVGGFPVLVGKGLRLKFRMTSERYADYMARYDALQRSHESKEITEAEFSKILDALVKDYWR